MTSVFGGWSLFDSDSVTNWGFEKQDSGQLRITALMGKVTIYQLFVNTHVFKGISDINKHKGLYSEALQYMFMESEQMKKPAHMFRVTDIIQSEVVGTLTLTEEERTKDPLNSVAYKIITAAEGSYVTIDGVDECFTRVGAVIALKSMNVVNSVKIDIYGVGGNSETIHYP